MLLISLLATLSSHLQFSALPPVRVVFSITMEGGARKVITVRSSLMVKNRLDVPMEVRLDSPSAPDSKSRQLAGQRSQASISQLQSSPGSQRRIPFLFLRSCWSDPEAGPSSQPSLCLC